MIKFVCFLSAFLFVVSPAKGALLVSYSFTANSASPTVSSVDVLGLNASLAPGAAGASFANSRIETGGINATPDSSFMFAVGSKPWTQAWISKVEFQSWIFSGLNNRATLTVRGQVGSVVGGVFTADNPSSFIDLVTGGAGLLNSTANRQFTVSLTGSPVHLAVDKWLQVVVSVSRSGSSITDPALRPSVAFDNLKFSGSTVPEPASLAVFALAAVPFAVRRFRKSK